MVEKINNFFEYINMNNKRYYISLTIFSIVFGFIATLLFCYCASPLYFQPNSNGCDSSMIKVLGTTINDGGKPYIDCLDHKGPYLFWYSALAAFINRTYGFYVMQSIVSAICIFGVIELCRSLKLSKLSSLFVVCFFVTIYFTAFEGTTADDAFMFAMILPIAYVVRGIINNDTKYLRYAIFLNGLCLGILLFVRPSNVLIPMLLALLVVIYCFYNKCIKELFIIAAFGFLGIFITSGIAMLVSYLGGYFNEMMEYTFIKNFSYSRGTTDIFFEKKICIFLAFETSIAELIIVILFRKSFSKELFIFMAILSGFLLFSGLTMCVYTHHFKQFTGLYILTLAYPLKYLENKEFKYTKLILKIISSLTIVSMLIYGIISPIVTYNFTGETGHKNLEKLTEVKKYINENGKENPNLLAIDTISTSYLALDINPKYNKFTYQSWWQYNGVYPTLYEEMTTYIDSNVDYIIIASNSGYKNYDDFKIILETKFNLVIDYSYDGVWELYERI